METARWVEAARQGDTAAFRELFRRCRPGVVRMLDAFSSLDRDDVEDVVQESFARAFRALPKLKANVAFEPWLLTIARNRALTMMERKGSTERVRQNLKETQEEGTPLIPEAFKAELDEAVVRQLINELPEGPEKQTVQLFYVEGELSAREIAERLGVGKSAVTMRLERFRARVKRELLARVLRARWE
jgi:RNA polymerase sigma-70 factor (ECF subfamily)